MMAKNKKGIIEIFLEYSEGLKSIEEFSYIILLYSFHLSQKAVLKIEPYIKSDQIHGIFTTRAPDRPNPIGISVVRLNRVEGNKLHVQDVDILDKTPLLDIKPYVPGFDTRVPNRIGWYEKNN
ncbi:tRNA (N6-threonylcarbamoyladenosine(37)-N6)-methyltransferase TrmO [bacterium]|nr:tRNA (N6-threonylcarbamoyladenosine(37)-N6)-methyltransferase TrmO [bacterium]